LFRQTKAVLLVAAVSEMDRGRMDNIPMNTAVLQGFSLKNCKSQSKMTDFGTGSGKRE
jgi:hypothetical protein